MKLNGKKFFSREKKWTVEFSTSNNPNLSNTEKKLDYKMRRFQNKHANLAHWRNPHLLLFNWVASKQTIFVSELQFHFPILHAVTATSQDKTTINVGHKLQVSSNETTTAVHILFLSFSFLAAVKYFSTFFQVTSSLR